MRLIAFCLLVFLGALSSPSFAKGDESNQGLVEELLQKPASVFDLFVTRVMVLGGCRDFPWGKGDGGQLDIESACVSDIYYDKEDSRFIFDVRVNHHQKIANIVNNEKREPAIKSITEEVALWIGVGQSSLIKGNVNPLSLLYKAMLGSANIAFINELSKRSVVVVHLNGGWKGNYVSSVDYKGRFNYMTSEQWIRSGLGSDVADDVRSK